MEMSSQVTYNNLDSDKSVIIQLGLFSVDSVQFNNLHCSAIKLKLNYETNLIQL